MRLLTLNLYGIKKEYVALFHKDVLPMIDDPKFSIFSFTFSENDRLSLSDSISASSICLQLLIDDNEFDSNIYKSWIEDCVKQFKGKNLSYRAFWNVTISEYPKIIDTQKTICFGE